MNAPPGGPSPIAHLKHTLGWTYTPSIHGLMSAATHGMIRPAWRGASDIEPYEVIPPPVEEEHCQCGCL